MATVTVSNSSSTATGTGNMRAAGSTNDGSTQRTNRPRPLKLEQIAGSDSNVKFRSAGLSFTQPAEPIANDELLELMQGICAAVKGGQYNSQLATEIFRLYQQLKLQGQHMEQNHKNEMNRVFIALRQACCRDSGQLGTPCRLKIMELVELRAMCWRPNLAHSQYYLNRPTSDAGTVAGHASYVSQPITSHHNEQQHMMSSSVTGHNYSHGNHVMSGVSQQQSEYDHAANVMAGTYTSAPISAPPFGTVPLNPFAFAPPPPQPTPTIQNINTNLLQHQLHHQHSHPPHTQHIGQLSMDMGQMTPTTGGLNLNHHGIHVPVSTSAAPSYYLIPASGMQGAFVQQHGMHQMAVMQQPTSPIGPPPMPPPFALGPPQTQPHPQGPPPPPQHQLSLSAVSQLQTAHNIAASGGQLQLANGSEGFWPKGAVVKASGKYTRPQKVPGKSQYRDEIVIRNADSGKIMGVKGRRVAVVEEISKTIISFQKVAQGAKERTLTITGNTEETIDHAKILIEETIRRNVSPNRPEGGEEGELDLDEQDLDQREELGEETGVGLPGGLQLTDINSNFTSVKALEGGFLKLSCEDPEVLQAAQEALNEYFTRLGPLRRSQGAVNSAGVGGTKTERELRRERRKSMPSFSPDAIVKPAMTTAARAAAANKAAGTADADMDWRRKRASSQDRADYGNGKQEERATTESPRAESTRKEGGGGGNKVVRRANTSGAIGARAVMAKSTPNLSTEGDENEDGDVEGTEEENPLPPPAPPRFQLRVVYTKDYLLKCAGSPLAEMIPGNMPHITKESPEIIRTVPGKINATDYKEKVNALRQSLLTQSK